MKLNKCNDLPIWLDNVPLSGSPCCIDVIFTRLLKEKTETIS